MLMPRVVVWMLSLGLLVFGAGMASGQDYPSKPIRIVTGATGGGPDLLARLIAPGISGSLGQQVIVDNRASGVIPGEIVAKAPPDGHTLLVSTGLVWFMPFMQNVPFDPVRDFSPITLALNSPNVLVVNPSVAANSVKELIALAKARPGELNYASGGAGGSAHLAAELFKAMAGVNIVRINYKGGGPALNALVAGEVQLMIANAPSAAPHIRSGRLRTLAVTSAQSSVLFPGLPTVAATVPGYESVTVTGIFAPAKTPATLINRLNQEIVRVLNRADVKEKFLNAGVEVVASSPEQLAATMRAEIARMGKVIKDAGIRE